jgi:hypothetical protein
MIVHHTRKSDGKEFTAGRGSGGLPAFAETIVELRRFNADDRKDRRRKLTGGGRYPETKQEWVIELNDTGNYVGIGEDDPDGPAVGGGDWKEIAAGMIGAAGPSGMTVDDIQAGLKEAGAGVRVAELRSWLKADAGSSDGRLAVIGRGAKGDPVRYAGRP